MKKLTEEKKGTALPWRKVMKKLAREKRDLSAGRKKGRKNSLTKKKHIKEAWWIRGKEPWMTEGKEPKTRKGLRRTMLEQRKAIGGTWLDERFLRKSLSMKK
jgi:hypothetical protein